MSNYPGDLSSIRALRAMFRDTPVAEIEEIIEKMTVVLGEIRDEQKIHQEAIRIRAEKIARYREMMLHDGIDPGELLDNVISGQLPKPIRPKRQRKPVPPKYSYRESDGTPKLWSGRGRMPLIIKNAVEQGKNIEEFLIPALLTAN